MRRRSTLGMGTGVAPVRTVDLPELEPAFRTSRASVVPRQLSFNSNASQCTQQSTTAQPERRRSVLSSASAFRTARTNLYGRPNTNESVLDGIAELAQSMSESTIASKDSTSEAINNPKSLSTVVTAPSLDSSSLVSKPKLAGTKKTVLKSTSANKSSTSKNETRIPRCKNSSCLKRSTPVAQLNSTAAFEEAEIAAMTSTPHPTRSIKRSAGHPSMVDLGDFTEQMKHLFADQRNMMQVVKLAFQKINLLADSQLTLNLLLIDVLKQFKHRHDTDGVDKLNTVDSTNDFVCTGNELGNNPKPEECTGIGSHSSISLNVLAPSHQENKENFAGHSRRSEFVFNSMKSQLNCLKTPTTLKSVGPLVPETPNTLLSNTVHHQLENLFETSETE